MVIKRSGFASMATTIRLVAFGLAAGLFSQLSYGADPYYLCPEAGDIGYSGATGSYTASVGDLIWSATASTNAGTVQDLIEVFITNANADPRYPDVPKQVASCRYRIKSDMNVDLKITGISVYLATPFPGGGTYPNYPWQVINTNTPPAGVSCHGPMSNASLVAIIPLQCPLSLQQQATSPTVIPTVPDPAVSNPMANPMTQIQ